MTTNEAKRMMVAALNASLLRGEVPDRRTDVTVDGKVVSVFGAYGGRTVQFRHDGRVYSANIRKGNKLGPVSSWNA